MRLKSMAILSTLRSTNLNKQLAHSAEVYVRHRPTIQRFIVGGFVLYVLGTTYRGLSARPNVSRNVAKRVKGGSDSKGDGKPQRVAVIIPMFFLRLP